MDISRRRALGLLAGTAAAATLHDLAFPLALAGPDPDIAVAQGTDPASCARSAVASLGGIGRFVSRGDKVVVKPNMGFGYPPARGATTEPAVVRALVELALSAGAARVMVFDNPCHAADIAVETCGVKAALAGMDDVFVYTLRKDDLFREVAVPGGQALKKAEVGIDILEADTIINVPVAKSHSSAKVSFGMKNWMGVVKSRRPWHVVMDLDQCIADLATLVRPKLTVLDATRAMVTGGPGGPGRLETLGMVVAGTDPVAVDAFGLTLARFGGDPGYTVDDVRHIRLAEAAGVGRADLAPLVVRRERV